MAYHKFICFDNTLFELPKRLQGSISGDCVKEDKTSRMKTKKQKTVIKNYELTEDFFVFKEQGEEIKRE